MVTSFIERFLITSTIEEPNRSDPHLHFERLAFTLGQHACLNALLQAVEQGYLAKPRMPSFVTNKEATFWEMGILSETSDCGEVVDRGITT